MRKFRIVAALVAACGVVGPGVPAAAAAPSGTTDVSVAVPMTCTGGTTQTVTVSATLPDRVRAGRAYTVTNLTTDVPNNGAVTIATGQGQPATFAAGTFGSSTLQLVAGPQPGTPIVLQVTAAGYLNPGQILNEGRPVFIPGSGVGCAPAAPVTLGSIKVIGQGRGPATETTAVTATLGLESLLFGQPFVSNPGIVTATVPTEL